MKRILLTVHKFFPKHRAGTEVLTQKVACELQRRGYQVSILTTSPTDVNTTKETQPQPDKGEISSYVWEGITVYSLNETTLLQENRFSNEHYHPYLKKIYRELFDTLAPDLVHCFHLQNLSSSLIEEANSRNLPVMYSATDFWLICPIVQLRRPDGSNCRGPSPLAINCLTCYTPELLPEEPEFIEALVKKYPGTGNKLRRLPKLLNKLISSGLYTTYLAKKLPAAVSATVERAYTLKHFANRLAAITVPTRLMQDLFIQNGLSADLIDLIHYGIDTEPLKKGQNKTASDDLRFAFIGTLSEHKGPDLLVKAFLQLPQQVKANLTLYGDPGQFPDYYRSLRQLADNGSALSKKIAFAGTFPNDNIGNIFSNIDVLIVPSRWYENTPLVIQSALASKTPVIATDLGGMSELVKHEFNGLLFEANNVQSLLAQLLKLTENRPLLAQLINNIKPERTVADMVDQLETVYTKIGISNNKTTVSCASS
jgi:glycosyltransferase involved in cell wall biosynthesis